VRAAQTTATTTATTAADDVLRIMAAIEPRHDRIRRAGTPVKGPSGRPEWGRSRLYIENMPMQPASLAACVARGEAWTPERPWLPVGAIPET
jgi:hypothetical protein